MSQPETAVAADAASLPLAVVDGLRLGEKYREVLRPGETMADREGRVRRLPRFFYELPSWEAALEIQLAPHFGLWELLAVDVREAAPQRTFPRYVPCSITLLAGQLELFRLAVGTYVHIAANGGYRSPGHALSRYATPHCWAAAANIYKVGNDLLDTQERVERYARVAKESVPGLWVRPYGPEIGQTDDHLHVDLGYVTLVPRSAGSESDE
jgi:hypothetical protein